MQNRREFLKKATLAAGAGTLLTTGTRAATADELNASFDKSRKRILRFAHITDVHILNKSHAIASFSTVMKEINAMKDKPDFIINSGDTVMDMNNATEDTVKSHWQAWDDCVQYNKLPMYSCIGNHDVWYVKKEEETAEITSSRHYWKGWIIEKLKMPARYYSFTKGNWKFIALDSIENNQYGFQFDAEQLAWLDKELASAGNSPVCIFSHVPVISFTPLMYMLQSSKIPLGNIKFPGGDLHTDLLAVKEILYRHKNVKLALSGHVHYIDVLDYLGTKYVCGGAVSSNWWNGVLEEFPNAYGIVDIYEDGTSEYRIVFYQAAAS